MGNLSLGNVLTILGAPLTGASSVIVDPDPEVPANALLDTDGNPILDTDGNYIQTA